MNVSTVHRLLAALVNKQILRQDPATAKYGPGPWLLDVALAYLRRLDLPQVALPFMHRLRNVTQETVTLTMRDGMSRIYLAQVESPQEIRQTVETGRRLPLLPGGSGKAVLAFLPPEEIEAYLAEHGHEAGNAADLARLRAELEHARHAGFAWSRSERLSGAASVAAPVRDFRGAVIGSMSVSGPAERFTDASIARYGELVRATADEVSRSLGAARPSAAAAAIQKVA